MSPKSMCDCMWQWKSVNPGLSATKSTAAVLLLPPLITSFTNSWLSRYLGDFEHVTVQVERMDVAAIVVECQSWQL